MELKIHWARVSAAAVCNLILTTRFNSLSRNPFGAARASLFRVRVELGSVSGASLAKVRAKLRQETGAAAAAAATVTKSVARLLKGWPDYSTRAVENTSQAHSPARPLARSPARLNSARQANNFRPIPVGLSSGARRERRRWRALVVAVVVFAVVPLLCGRGAGALELRGNK